MNQHPPRPPLALRDRLLAAEPASDALRAEYERKLIAMLEKRLSTPKRIWLGLLAAFAGAAALLLTELQISDPLKPLVRVGLGLGIVFSLTWAAFLGRMAWRGTMRLKADATIYANIVWGFVLVTAVFFAVIAKDRDPFLIYCFLFLLPASVVVLRTVIEQSELRTRERLLELEYKLAQLAEGTKARG